MKKIFLSGLVAASLGAWTGVAPATAQTPVCPPGYYYASDGQCYPGAPPAYAPPVYEVAPPVYQPPAILDGLAIGLGLGAIIGGIDHGGGGYRDGGGRGGDRGRR
jgi:hypothetical protein